MAVAELFLSYQPQMWDLYHSDALAGLPPQRDFTLADSVHRLVTECWKVPAQVVRVVCADTGLAAK